jgi:hypothetical protein
MEKKEPPQHRPIDASKEKLTKPIIDPLEAVSDNDTGQLHLSRFLLESPLADTNLSIPRDYLIDRYIEIEP